MNHQENCTITADDMEAVAAEISKAAALSATQPAQAQQSEPAKPLFASKVAARKWAELQDDGARMQSIAFDGHKSGQPGTIDPWGVVRWVQAQHAGEVVAKCQNCGGIGYSDAWTMDGEYNPTHCDECDGGHGEAYTTPPAPAQPAQQPAGDVARDAAALRFVVTHDDWAICKWGTFGTEKGFYPTTLEDLYAALASSARKGE